MVVLKDRILIYILSDQAHKFKPFKRISKKFQNFCTYIYLHGYSKNDMISLYTFQVKLKNMSKFINIYDGEEVSLKYEVYCRN